MTKQLTFKRPGSKAVIDIKYINECLSISGVIYEGKRDVAAGQIQDTLKQEFIDVPGVKRLVEVWNRWHLNHMNAGDQAQEARLRELKSHGWEYVDYDHACAQLEADGLLVHDGYKYGSEWKFEAVPAEIIAELEGM